MQRYLRNLPIRRKLLFLIVGTTSAALIATAIVFVMYSWFSTRQSISDNLTAVTDVFARNTTAALSFNDEAAATEILATLHAKQEVSLACIYQLSADNEKQLFSSYQREKNLRSCPTNSPKLQQKFGSKKLKIMRPIVLGGDIIGHIYIERELHDLGRSTNLVILVVSFVVFVSVIFAIFISSLMQRLIAAPIQNLLQTTKNVSKSSDYSLRAEHKGRDEIGELIAGFNDMLKQIEARDLQLERAHEELRIRIDQADSANTELQSALKTLEKTQDKLVEVEKMASLGNLVAGIAHEINTPIGVGVTAASTFRSATIDVNERQKRDDLSPEKLDFYLTTGLQISDIILRNLERAAELIHSFKQVAVDQSNSGKRVFHIKKYLEETLLSLKPKLRNTGIEVEIDCNATLEIYSTPGALSQIITNLVVNSILHGYENRDKGTIRIALTIEDDIAHLKYRDDGIGMTATVLKKVFDPFFTTRRGSGGSGLGMHIVYNLVTQQLEGHIDLASEPNQGMTVDICFPVSRSKQEAVVV